MNRYGTVTITADTLRVGRDRLPLSTIDPEWVRMLASKASPTLRERVLTSASTIQVPAHVQVDPGRGRLLGGAYGTSMGSDQVTLRLTDGSRVTAPSNDREGRWPRCSPLSATERVVRQELSRAPALNPGVATDQSAAPASATSSCSRNHTSYDEMARKATAPGSGPLAIA